MKLPGIKLSSITNKYDGAVLNIRTLIIISTCLFCAGLASGFFFTPDKLGLSEEISSLERLAQTLTPFHISTVIFIYLKNLLALVISLLLGPFLCLAPIFTLLLNGWVISFVSLPLIRSGSVALLVVGILPHGIFEIPALILGEAIALGFGLAILSLVAKRKWNMLGAVFRQNLRYFIIVIVLLIPAAFIETFITPLLIAQFI